jgi:glycosyltransferase 2 family protein
MKLRGALVSAVVIALLIVAARHVDWHRAITTLARASWPPLVVAVVINLVSIALRGVRWWIFLRRVGDVPLSLAMRGAVVGSGFNNLLVANGGDATRALFVARLSGIGAAPVLATLALDRMFDPICFGLMLLVGTFIVPLPPQLSAARPIVIALLVVVAVLLAVLSRDGPARVVPSDPAGDWRERLRRFRGEVRTLSTRRRFAMALLVSIGVWLLQLATFVLAARSIGLGLPIAGSVAAMLLTNAGLILRATPGNVGFFQFAYAVAASRFGVAAAPAIASAVLLQLVQMVPTTLLAVGLAQRVLRAVESER